MPWDGIHALIERARAGDQNAWTDLYALIKPYLLGLAQKFLGPGWPERTAQDLTHDACLKFSLHINDFRGGANDEQTAAVLRAWLKQTVARTFQNDLRYRNADGRSPPGGRVDVIGIGSTEGASDNHVDPPADTPSPSVEALQSERRTRIESALAQLADPLERTIVRNFFFESHSLRQIAGQLNLTYDQVRYRFDKALASLGDALGEAS